MFKFLRRIKFIFQFGRFFPFLKDFYQSREVPAHHKVLGALMILTYAFFPFDLIPDYLAFFGIVDDVVIATFILERLVKIAPQSLKDKHKIKNL